MDRVMHALAPLTNPEEAAKAIIQEKLKPNEYQAWIDYIQFHPQGEKLLVTHLPHRIFKYDLKKNYHNLFLSIAEQIWNCNAVEYYVGEYQSSVKIVEPEKRFGNSVTKTEQLEFDLPERWSEHHVEYPTDMTRVNPFRPLSRRKKRDFVEAILFVNKYGTVRYRGELLGVDDEDVFMSLLREAREELFQGKEVIEIEVGVRELLRKLGRQGDGNTIRWLKESLTRLRGGTMTFQTPRFTLVGGFLDGWKSDEQTGKLIIHLNRDLGKIYIKRAYTQIDFRERMNLSGDIAKKLHAFLNGQRNKNRHFSFTEEEAKCFLNSEASVRELRRMLKGALEQMVQIGFLKKYYIKQTKNKEHRFFVDYFSF